MLDEQELVHVIGRCGQQVAPESEQVPVPRVQAGDAAAAHSLHLMGHGNAGDGGPAKMVVRDQEGIGDFAERADLMADMHEVRPGRRLDLADNLERPMCHDPNLEAGSSPQPQARRSARLLRSC